ncbi:MAG: D-glycero-beta-D-manno-heptose-1,7-bisphosphate 7-phosphatase [Nitrospira sp.]|nr:D-glycero-beta-D-manno-heptose-1,7-bisphosphate 7-phosphatase [Nitrospira sp.]
MRRNLPRKILVRAPNWIGDAVMCEPAVRGLRSLFPEAELAMLAKPAVAELFLSYPGLHSVLVYDDKKAHAGISGKWSLADMLRRHRFDLAVLLQNAFEAAFLTWLAGIPRRYGYATDGRVFFLTEPVAVPNGPTPVHQVEYYWNLLKPLGLAGGAPLPTLLISADEKRTVDVRLASAGINSSDLIIGINPGSTYGSAKRWSSDRFAEVARRLVRRLEQAESAHVAVVILGAKGEESLGKDIAAQIGGRSVVLSGATTIRELMAVVKRCRVLMTNDTGPMHIAAAFGVPVVAVFGPTDWRTTSPYGQERSIVREAVDCAPCLLRECPIDHRCMTRIPVDRVYEAAVQQLGGSFGWSGLSGEKRQVEGSFGSSGLSGAPHANASEMNQRNETNQINQTNQMNQTNQTNILSGHTIFLDRDGTLNPDPGYIKSPDQFELFPGVSKALARLKRVGARLVVVTNQSGIARGLLSRDDLDAVHLKLKHLLGGAGVSLDGIYFCPHHPDDGCDCRKPNRGMIDQAVRELGVNLDRSYLIGDHIRDIELAKRIGARSVLVTTGVISPQEAERLKASEPAPDWIASSLAEAADWLLADASKLPVQIHDRQVAHP